MRHYLPILLLARELNVTVSGGFPPRQWASSINKAGVSTTRRDFDSEIPASFRKDGEAEWRWSAQVESIDAVQVSYLESMMADRPATLPPQTPLPPTPPPSTHSSRQSYAASFASATDSQPAENATRRSRGYFERGLYPAQAVKDTFLAWTIDNLFLRRQQPSSRHGRVDVVDDGRELNVLAICGLGHAEFGIGLLERLSLLSPSTATTTTTTTATDDNGSSTTGAVLSRRDVLLIASKDLDSGEYQIVPPPPPPPDAQNDSHDILADLVIPYRIDDDE